MSAAVVKGLTLWQPWAWCITRQGKRIENRPWHPWKGVTHVLLHAGKTYDKDAEMDICDELDLPYFSLPPEAHLQSAVIGTARIIGCIHSVEETAFVPGFEKQDVWWSGPHGWMLDDVRALEDPVPCAGALGLWTPPADVLRLVLVQVGPLEVPR